MDGKLTAPTRAQWAYVAAGFGKSNALLIGPTGSGKTLMCETLPRALEGRDQFPVCRAARDPARTD